MPFLVFFSHLSSLLSSSLKRLGSSSFSRISSHCLWYCPRGFSGKEVWSAFTPPSSAPPWQGENTGDTSRVTRPAHRSARRGPLTPGGKTTPYAPVTAIRTTWGPDSTLRSPLPHCPAARTALGSHFVSSGTMSISGVLRRKRIKTHYFTPVGKTVRTVSMTNFFASFKWFPLDKFPGMNRSKTWPFL